MSVTGAPASRGSFAATSSFASRAFTPKQGVLIFSGLLALAAVAAQRLRLSTMGALPLESHVTWWELALGFAAADVVFDIHLDIHSDTYSISPMEIPLVIGMFLASPLVVVGGAVIGTGLALALYRRQPPLKLFFNVSLLALESAVAVTVFRTLVEPMAQLGPKSWGPAFAAVVVANLISCGASWPSSRSTTALRDRGASVHRVRGDHAIGQYESHSRNGRGASEPAGHDLAARGHRRRPHHHLSVSCVSRRPYPNLSTSLRGGPRSVRARPRSSSAGIPVSPRPRSRRGPHGGTGPRRVSSKDFGNPGR